MQKIKQYEDIATTYTDNAGKALEMIWAMSPAKAADFIRYCNSIIENTDNNGDTTLHPILTKKLFANLRHKTLCYFENKVNLFTAINTAANTPDFNQAIALIQSILGQESGDIAGLHFADSDDIETDWHDASETGKKKVLITYVIKELTEYKKSI